MVSRKWLATIALASSGSFLMTACDQQPPPVQIKYEQRGACNGFQHRGGTTAAGPNRAYVIFRVSTIENTKAGAKDFNFNPERLYVDNTDPTAYVDTDIQIAALNPFALQGRVVKAGTTETFNGAAIAVVSTQDVDGAKEASQTDYALRYDATESPGALTEDTNPSQANWPYTPNCAQINF